ncbi:permease of the major facilitator superfamily [Penicillium maclennaniae]|uniref:permease of the major facilitator superfamily n=1 Tax=Penicillium maclennaniae TaxID=1343394 RepID=UPI0025405B2F|nr:permease of the major facilitator superfamily [Penicillium maclennaniae]KAJ5684596.1 permease of the major facilitator superfamily [Penicillium maclennaniae]
MTDPSASPTSSVSTASTVIGTPTDTEKAMTLEKLPQEFCRLGSWRGALILLVTSGSQSLDNVFMTSSNMALASIQEGFDVSTTNLQWMISAYTLTFGGFLLLAGALSDRYGRKFILCLGLLWLSIWTLAIGFGRSFIQLTVFRGIQGIGAAMTVPSAIGIISSYFTGTDRTRALSIYAASGTLGFCAGLILGGFLTTSLGWRYIYYIIVIMTGALRTLGLIVLPGDRAPKGERPRMDYCGAVLSTVGLILLQFVLSSGGVYGWDTSFVIVILILSIALLVAFVLLMPLSLWKLPNFAGLWIAGFTCYGSYQDVIYYVVLIAQKVDGLSAGETALSIIAHGSHRLHRFHGNRQAARIRERKICTFRRPDAYGIGTDPERPDRNRNDQLLGKQPATSLISISAVSFIFVTTSTTILTSVPVKVKSLCGGMLNTAFQIGSGVALAISAATTEVVDIKKGHDLDQQYSTGLWCSTGLAGLGLIIGCFAVRRRGIGPKDRAGGDDVAV